MTPDELKSMPKGQFIVMKTGAYPIKVKLKLFFQWGITFGEPYQVEDKGNRPVAYAGKQALVDAILEKYPPQVEDLPEQEDLDAPAIRITLGDAPAPKRARRRKERDDDRP